VSRERRREPGAARTDAAEAGRGRATATASGPYGRSRHAAHNSLHFTRSSLPLPIPPQTKTPLSFATSSLRLVPLLKQELAALISNGRCYRSLLWALCLF